jgi:hypothetical protein
MTSTYVQDNDQVGSGLAPGKGVAPFQTHSPRPKNRTRHRKAASESAWSGPISSIKETLKSDKLNSLITSKFRHSAPSLGHEHSEGMRNDEQEPQRANHGRSRSNDDRARLGNQLYAVLQNDATITGRLFVPKDDLDDIITQETVERELSRVVYFLARISPKAWRTATPLQIGSSLERANEKHTSAEEGTSRHPAKRYVQQIFAILLLMDRPTKIWSFLKEGVFDADLPLKTSQGRLITSSSLHDPRKPTSCLKCLKKRRDIFSFVEKQWMVLVPVFEQSSRKEISHLKVDDQQSLPFLHWEQRGLIGSFGEIYRAKIHPDHCTFSQAMVSHDRKFKDSVVESGLTELLIRHREILWQ